MTKTSHFCLTESFLIMKYFYTFLATIVFSTSIAQVINYTVEVPAGTTAVRLTGPWWGWDPAGGPVATDNGDGTWTVALDQTVQNVQIYDLTGRVVHKASPNKANFNFDVSHLSKGVYLLKVNAGNKEATLKLAK